MLFILWLCSYLCYTQLQVSAMLDESDFAYIYGVFSHSLKHYLPQCWKHLWQSSKSYTWDSEQLTTFLLQLWIISNKVKKSEKILFVKYINWSLFFLQLYMRRVSPLRPRVPHCTAWLLIRRHTLTWCGIDPCAASSNMHSSSLLLGVLAILYFNVRRTFIYLAIQSQHLFHAYFYFSNQKIPRKLQWQLFFKRC